MANNYSRRQQPTKKTKGTSRKRPTEHIKTGFSALQKSVAIIAGILGIITALITINNYRNSSHNDKKDSTSKTTIIKEKEVDDSNSNNNTANSQAENDSNNNNNSAESNQNQTATTANDSNSNSANQNQANSQSQANNQQNQNNANAGQ
ncbi:hypothetical protein D3842_03355 [Streptococcus mutans]|uniref:DUF6556 family protein n=1 Tax=Streptococcus mutans TaxID=1309 RepID=UPI001454F1DD|nr:DUF6556 family protein [Streptococcus mutans]NLQ98988.1 hypothetical protein [Streptococcus mutans]